MAKKLTQQSKKSNQESATGISDSTENWLPWLLAAISFILYSTGFGN